MRAKIESIDFPDEPQVIGKDKMKGTWFTSFSKKQQTKLRLFCFPYAGGSSAIYARWSGALPEYAELLALQPPGRAGRIAETPLRSMRDMVDGVVDSIVPLLDVEYAFFGHSLGSIVAFEVALRLDELGYRKPWLFIASGSPAPSIRRKEKAVSELPDALFVQKLRELGGTPEAVLQNEELMGICFPALRADFAILDNYPGNSAKLACTAHVLYGTQDTSMTELDAARWREHFDHGAQVHAILGDHYFIDHNGPRVVSLVNEILDQL